MKASIRRVAFGALFVAAATLAIAFGLSRGSSGLSAASLRATYGNAGAAVDRVPGAKPIPALKLEARDLAGNRGEPNSEGDDISTDVNGPAMEKFLQQALPTGTIPANSAKLAFGTWQTYGENKEYTRSAEPNNPFYWDLIGPTHATQPGILSFSGALFHMAGRITSMINSPVCSSNSNCRLWVAAAGGGIWRTDNPFSPDPYWVFTSKGFRTNAIGTIDRDPNDASGNTLYAGTGEPNASGDSESGVGIYKTTDGGDTWTLLPGSEIFATRSISKVVVPPGQPNTIYVGVARGIRGYTSVTGGAFSRTGPCLQFPVGGLGCGDGPEQAPLGLYESTDGGATFHLAWDVSTTSVRGVNDVGLDPTDPNCVYASAFNLGIWRRCPVVDGTGTFKQVFQPAAPALNTDRTQFDLTTVGPGGDAAAGTRIYAVDGQTGAPPAHVWRADGANTLTAAALLATEGNPVTRPPSPNTGAGWAKKSANSSRPASNPYRPAFNSCTGQCWYDADIYTPAGHPNIVYLLGSYQYSELHERSNGRGVMISLTAGDPDPTTAASAQVPTFTPPGTIGPPFSADATGGNFTDLTWDDTPGAQPDQTHPDQHAIVTASDNPFLYFEGSDGGIIRSDGTFDNASADCVRYHVNDPDTLVHCQRVLSRVPHQLYDITNKGLSTLQFQSLSVNPDRPKEDVQGGTQDNGTFDWDGQPTQWFEEMYGDGGQSGYNYCDSSIRFNTFFGYYTDENFQNGQVDKWYVTSGPLSQLNNGETQSFYIPEVTDYTNCGPIKNFPQFQTEAARLANTNLFAGGAIAGRTGTFEATPSAGQQLGAVLGFQYAGEQHVWRTVDNGGPEAYLQTCPEFTTSGDEPRCGDWQPLGDPAYTAPGHKTSNEPGDLTSSQYGADRRGLTVVAIERNPGNSNELWAATGTGRVFVSFNVNNVDPKTVSFCRLDQLSFSAAGPDAVAPPRFVSSIYPDPANPNRAWLSYNGYNSNTKDQPGHVFEVTFVGATTPTSPCPTIASWRDLHVEQGAPGHSDPAADIPITDLVRDDFTGDLYASTDFGVLRGKFVSPLTYTWTEAGVNLPRVETPGLTIDPCSRLLYAATHGRSAWRMYLPKATTPSQPCPRTP